MSDSELSDAPDAWLWKVMQKHKNREMIALLEDTLTSFVHDSKQTSLRFPPRNSFHRRVCYAVARRYQLAHKLESIPDAPLSSSDALRLVLIKTPHSSIPTHRLAHFASLPPPPQPQQPSAAQQQQQSFPSSSNAHVDNCHANSSTNPTPNPSQQPTSASTSGTLATPARFLRRPTTSNAKPARPRIPSVSSSLSSASAPALRSITEEDYRK
ncbi:R3H [Gracilaria domingensis]|nr:R3H [Gracilaria domingensis]